jgi:hypothetical protein
LAVRTRGRSPATLDSLQTLLEDIWFALQAVAAPTVNLPPEVRIPAPMVHVSPAAVHLPAPVVNYQPPDITLPPLDVRVEREPWPPELLDAIGAIRDVARIPQGAGGGVPLDLPPVVEALGRIEKLLSQQRQSEGRTLGLVPPAFTKAADGSLTVTVQNPGGSVIPTAVVAFVTAVPVAGTAVNLAANAVQGGIVQAPSTNAGIVYVGVSTVTSSAFGAELQPGQSAGIAVSNTNLLWVNAATNGDKVAFFGS